MSAEFATLAVLGGTGSEGAGLAFRWMRAGHPVIIGSRDPARAQATADELGDGARGATNVDAARACDIAVLTVPFAAQKSTLADVKDALAGKILVDVTVPLVPPRVARVQLPPEGSAAQAESRPPSRREPRPRDFRGSAAHLGIGVGNLLGENFL